MDAVGQKLLEVAKGQLGYSEKPSGYSKYGDWFATHVDKSHDSYYNTAPWCDMFLAWAADQAGVQDWAGEFASTIEHAKWFQQQHAWGTTPEPGAIVFYSWTGGGVDGIDHVGIVESVSGHTLHTIEGNTDGGQLERRVRSTSQVVGYGYPGKVQVSGHAVPGSGNDAAYLAKHAAPGPGDSQILTQAPPAVASKAAVATHQDNGFNLQTGEVALTGAMALLLCGSLALAVGKSTAAKVPAIPTPAAPRLRKRGKHHRTAEPVALPADLTPAEFEMVSEEAEMSTVMMPIISAEVAQQVEDKVFWGKIAEIKDDEELAFWDDLHTAVGNNSTRNWFEPASR